MFGKFFKRRRESRGVPAGNPLASRVAVGDDSPTESYAEGEGVPRRGDSARDGVPGSLRHRNAEAPPVDADAATRIIAPPPDAIDEGPEDPPVAVLLVVAGAGRGQLLPLGHGMNSIGRAADQRVRIDFGDERISRERHALLTYDPQGRRFFLQPGGGPGLTYLRGRPVLEPVDLADGDRIAIGDTELLFRALVGEDFDWSEKALNAPAP